MEEGVIGTIHDKDVRSHMVHRGETADSDVPELQLLNVDGINNNDKIYLADRISNRTKCRILFRKCVVVFGAFWSCFFSLGVAFSLGTFLPAWLDRFKDGRAETSLIQSIHVGMLFGAGTIVGVIIERFGLMLTVIGGGLLACIGFIGAVFASSVVSLIISVGVISGFGFCCIFLCSIVAVSSVFSESASIALGFVIAGGGVGQSVCPYICNHLINTYGWRGAFFIISGLALQPTMFGYLMTTFARQVKCTQSSANRVEEKQSLCDKLRHVCFPRYAMTCITTALAFSALNGFFFVLFDFASLRQGDGVFFTFLITTVSTVCNVIFGIVNRHPKVSSSGLLGFAVILGGLDLIIMSFIEGYAALVVLILGFGVAYGGLISISGVVVLELVGSKAYSLGAGINITINGIISPVGGIIYGLLYDLTKSYRTPLLSMGITSCVVGILPIIGIILSRRQQHNKQ